MQKRPLLDLPFQESPSEHLWHASVIISILCEEKFQTSLPGVAGHQLEVEQVGLRADRRHQNPPEIHLETRPPHVQQVCV